MEQPAIGVPTYCRHRYQNKLASIQHCIDRARQHYGLELTTDDIVAIEAEIQLGLTEFIRRAGAETASTVHRIPRVDRDIYVVYSSKFSKLMTVLPKRWAVRHSDNYLGRA